MHFRVRQQQLCCPYPQGLEGQGYPHQSAMHTEEILLPDCCFGPSKAHLAVPVHTKTPLSLAHSTNQHSQLCSGCNSPSCPTPRDSSLQNSWRIQELSPANSCSVHTRDPLYPSQGLLAASSLQHSRVVSEGAQSASADLQRRTRPNPELSWNSSHSCHTSQQL